MFKQMIQGFEQFLINCSSVFSLRYSILLFTLFFVETEFFKIFSKAEAKTTSGKPPFTLLQHLDDQKEVLHGYEARALRFIVIDHIRDMRTIAVSLPSRSVSDAQLLVRR